MASSSDTESDRRARQLRFRARALLITSFTVLGATIGFLLTDILTLPNGTVDPGQHLASYLSGRIIFVGIPATIAFVLVLKGHVLRTQARALDGLR